MGLTERRRIIRRYGQDGECIIMRQPSLITTAAAALLAGTMFAAAQGAPKQAPGGPAEGGGAAQVPHEQGQQPKAKQDGQGQRGKQQQGQKDPGKQGTTGQGEQREQGKQGQAKDQGKAEQGKQGQVKDQRKGSTTGQGQPKEQQGQAKEGQRPEGQQGQGREGQAREGQARQGGSGSVTLTTEQRTHIRETVLAGGNAPRVTNVNFAISVGTEVPRTVRVVEVPSVLVEYRPEWRGYYYFVLNDQIIVVDRNHRIVAVLDV
jgi:hypothetical protein